MNSDFMQVEAEELAKRVATEANNRERIKKAYRYVYGREANEREIAFGLEYLKTEPLLEYEERKKKAPEPGPGGPGMRRRGGPGGPPSEVSGLAAKPEGAPMPTEEAGANAGATAAAAAAGDGAGAMGMGMMGGMGGRRPGPAAPVEVKYEATVWGRYAKVLLSSSEFLFIN
jgi:hypothetical protein